MDANGGGRGHITRWTRILPAAWSDLRSIGNSRLTKLTIFAPFIPFIFDFFDNLIAIPFLGPYLHQFRIEWPRPRLTSLYFFYYGLTSVGIASILYGVLCPKIIKLYSSAVDYINEEAQVRSNYIKGEHLVAEGTSFPRLDLHDPELASLIDRQSLLDISYKMAREYEFQDHNKAIGRIIAFALYIMGFLLCSLPALNKFAIVTQHLVAHYGA
jgi:hypothetical protein